MHLHGNRSEVLSAGALSAALAGAYLAWQPPSADLSAQFFRADEFSAHGLEIWNNAWYSGHYLAGYSLVSPALGALMGPPLLGAVVAVVSAVAFAAIARRGYGDRALPGSLWFAAGTATLLLTGRITFALGIAIALLALLALPWRGPAAPLLGAAAGLASPVAGLFVAPAAAPGAYAGPDRGQAPAPARGGGGGAGGRGGGSLRRPRRARGRLRRRVWGKGARPPPRGTGPQGRPPLPLPRRRRRAVPAVAVPEAGRLLPARAVAH